MEELHMGKGRQEFNTQEMLHISKCIHKVKRLHITAIEATCDGWKHLSDAITNLHEPVCIVFICHLQKISIKKTW